MFRLNRSGTGGSALAVAAILVLGALGLGARGASAQVVDGTLDGERFGASVAWAGDVNGDGYADVLIGAPRGVGPAGAAGRVELHLGRYGRYPGAPDRVYYGQVSGDQFGFAVSSAGDVNHDGFDDFLIGAPGNDGSGLNAGRVYLYLGGSVLPSGASRTYDGDLPGARCGAAVAGGFHFNGDAYADFALGSPEITDTREGGAGAKAGQVRIYLGAGSLAGITQPYTLYGDQANWYLGYSLDPAGDVNHDGYDDLIAGAPQPVYANPGQAVIWYGRASTLGALSRTVLTGEVGTDRFGWSVTGAGDVDQDGYDDVLVGAPAHDGGGADYGAIYLYRGGNPPGLGYAWRALGGNGQDSLGYAVDGGFDMNGDGVPDLAAGAVGADRPGARSGEVRIYYGSGSPAAAGDRVVGPDSHAPGYTAHDGFGASVRFAGSINGAATAADARAELLAGAPFGNITSGIEAGYVDVITDPGAFVPVRVLAFTAAVAGGRAEIRWTLEEDGELSGVRVERERDGAWTPVGEDAWRAPASGAVRDPEPADGAVDYRLRALLRDGSTAVVASTRLEPGRPGLALGAPDRNPFRDGTRFQVSVPGGPVSVAVVDARGREVRRLLGGSLPSGTTVLAWDGRDDHGRLLPAGLYFVRARAGESAAAFKVIRLP